MAMRGIEVGGDLSSHFNQRGLFVLAAAQPDEGAFEKSEWGHGALTYTILKGLKGHADLNNNNQIDIVELFHYVEAQVADLTNGKQHPHFRMGGGSLPLFALP